MAPTNGKHVPKRAAAKEKLPSLPQGTRVEKRPLIHAQIPSPYAGAKDQKVIYLSSKTSFMAAFRRVKQLLKHIENRSMQSEAASGTSNQASRPLEEYILIKATGKAIEKAMSLALFLQTQKECKVSFRTGTVAAIDDIVNEDGSILAADLPESRIRHASVLEVAVSLS